MFSNRDIEHPKWGTLKIVVNKRARRIIMRAREGYIQMTVPPMATNSDLEKALAKHGARLRELRNRRSRKIDPLRIIGEGVFRINIEEYKGGRFMWVHNGSTATLMCPENTEYEKEQEWLRKVILNAVHEEAARVLPPRLKALAEKHGLKYNRCSVRDSHTRWGSCSGMRNISLSIYLVLLPDELIDYVILHELCHTVEMNHSERFWSKLDKLCNGDSKAIRQKLKRHSPEI